MDEKLKEIVSKISYKNYELIRIGSFWSTILTSAIDNQVLTDNIAIEGLKYSLAGLYGFLVFSRIENYTKEISAIKSTYGEIIDNYVKFMRDFNLNNPIQISTMHANMVEDGYLSINKKFEFDGKMVYDVNGLGPTNIMDGHGVCRHYAALLSDVLNAVGIDAFNLCVYFPVYVPTINLIDDKVGQSKEEICEIVRHYLFNPYDVKQIMEVVEKIMGVNSKRVEISLCNQKQKNIIKRIFGNHVICFAIQNGYSYYLDPTMRRIYHMDPDNLGKLCDYNVENINIKLLSSYFFNDSDLFEKMYKQVVNYYPTEEQDIINKLVQETTKIYEDNQDVCNKFYQENEENYQSISHNLSILKRSVKSKIINYEIS